MNLSNVIFNQISTQGLLVNIKTIDTFVGSDIGADDRNIPRKIWQTFKTNNVPIRMYKAAESWMLKNSDFDYHFLTDDECTKMIADFDGDLLRCYERTPHGAFRADIWRYCALYQFGGVYADMDTVCKYPMKKLIDNDDQFIVAYDANPRRLFNAFMCSSPRHPVLDRLLNNIKDFLLSKDGYEKIKSNPKLLYDITGPGGLARAVAEVMDLDPAKEFTTRVYSAKDCKVRVLRKFHKKPLWSRRVMLGLRTVLLCKYPGYFEDLKTAGGSHWK